MSEPKTYYGPWLPEVPASIPDGTIWEVQHTDYEPDFESALMPVRCVSFAGWLIDEDGRIARSSITSLRRVWPPGSVLPEPRPLAVDGNIRDLTKLEWWMLSSIQSDGSQFWESQNRNGTWIPTYSGTPDFDDDFGGDLCYPVDLLPNGAFVPRPWPDQCTEE